MYKGFRSPSYPERRTIPNRHKFKSWIDLPSRINKRMSNLSTIHELSDHALENLAASASIAEALRSLGITPRDPRARKALKDKLRAAGLELAGRNYRNYTVEDVQAAAKTASCFTDVLKSIGLAPHGGNIQTIRNVIESNNIDISHFDVTACFQRNKRVWAFKDIFCKNSAYPRPALRSAVFRFEVLEHKCTECGNEGFWNKKELPLDVDHINGDNADNRVENLRFLCPNCHRQTDTWGNKQRSLSIVGDAADL